MIEIVGFTEEIDEEVSNSLDGLGFIAFGLFGVEFYIDEGLSVSRSGAVKPSKTHPGELTFDVYSMPSHMASSRISNSTFHPPY